MGRASPIAALVATAFALSGCGGAARVGTHTQPAPTGRTAPATTTPTGATTATGAATPTHGTGPTQGTTPTGTAAPRVHRQRALPPVPNPEGSRPQTSQVPPASSRGFRAEMAHLWRGIQTNSVRVALPAFFPEAAYAQLKAIGDPQGDWRNRLVVEYGLDIAAAHALLGPHPERARLIGVRLVESFAHYIPPNVCSNAAGYEELPNARIVYRENGGVHSFGIASLISWRGVWYVVHLGAVERPSSGGGAVEDPSGGPGSSTPSSVC